MRKLAKLMLTAALIIPFAAGLPVRAMAVQSMDQPAQNMEKPNMSSFGEREPGLSEQPGVTANFNSSFDRDWSKRLFEEMDEDECIVDSIRISSDLSQITIVTVPDLLATELFEKFCRLAYLAAMAQPSEADPVKLLFVSRWTGKVLMSLDLEDIKEELGAFDLMKPR